MTSNQRNQSRRPSLSMAKPMSWLSGGSKSSVSSPITISEPKLLHDIYIAGTVSVGTSPRHGPLGGGATIVKTPQDALTTSMRSRTPPKQHHQQHQRPQQPQRPEYVRNSDTSSYEENEPPSPTSPRLPPLPFPSKSTPELMNISEATSATRNPELVPIRFRSRSIPPRRRTFIPPTVIPECPPQPACAPILLSPPPDVSLNPSTLMITLDTSTSSLRTTYSTLTSRPSHLADYLFSLAHSAQECEKRNFRETLVEADEEEEQEEDGDSLPPPDTPFASLFAAHLNSVGLVPRSAGSLHLFLDRPSSPYTHILSYLRSPITSPGILPRSATLGYSFTQERFDALLELRDEAKYLGMEELYQLCSEELRQAQTHFQTHARISSSTGSVSSNHSHNNSTSSASHNLFIPGSLDRGRAPGMMYMLREHHVNNSKLPNIVNRERHSGSSGAIPHVAEVVEHITISPISSPTRSRSRDQPSSTEGWI